MDRREKVEFILDQMRLSLAKKDYVRTAILVSFEQDEKPASERLVLTEYLHPGCRSRATPASMLTCLQTRH